MKFELLPQARDDLLAARRWYDQQAPGLGRAFGHAVRDTIARILEMPQSGAPWPGIDVSVGVRRRLLQRFPYAVAYYIEGESLVIAAVVHTSRNPRIWFDRLR